VQPARLSGLFAWHTPCNEEGMSILDIATAIQDSGVGTFLRESPFAYPLIEGLHLLGLAASFGLVFFIDLRLAGWLLREVPASRLHAALRPWLFVGFVLIFATGGLLFWAEAAMLVVNAWFIAKLVLMALALANALAFEHTWKRHGTAWIDQAQIPQRARLAGLWSLGLWIAVSVAGRLIPYYINR
jgi:hypothetical protein